MALKIGLYTHHWDAAGTARSHERIVEALDKNKFSPYVIYWTSGNNTRLSNIKKYPGVNLVPFERSLEKTNDKNGYVPVSNNFKEVVEKLNLDILHVARSGYFEFPFNDRIAPLQIETNIFGYKDISGFCDKSIAICNYIEKIRGEADAVVYNPIPKAEKEGDDLRSTYGIPKEAVVCGRIGRPSNFHPVAISAFAEVVKIIPNLYYIIVAPCSDAVQYVNTHKIPNVIFINPTNNDELINKFHRTIDIFAHYRHDGECHSTAISQAMAYGIPVISHKSHIHNGQIETIGDGGFVVEDSDEYKKHLLNLATLKSLRESVGKTALKIAEENYLQYKVVKQIEDLYISWLARK